MMQIRIGLRGVRYFEKREVIVDLLHQDDNGHVRGSLCFRINYIDIFVACNVDWQCGREV